MSYDIFAISYVHVLQIKINWINDIYIDRVQIIAHFEIWRIIYYVITHWLITTIFAIYFSKNILYFIVTKERKYVAHFFEWKILKIFFIFELYGSWIEYSYNFNNVINLLTTCWGLKCSSEYIIFSRQNNCFSSFF